MTDIYDQHSAAFSQVAAYVVLDITGKRVATIAFKRPRDGAGRLTVYAHWIGVPMVRGSASGYGYDKSTAALSSAASKIDDDGAAGTESRVLQSLFLGALSKDNGTRWYAQLEAAGFKVLQAV